MTLLTRIARALVLALLLPALLAPSGWSWQVCFCDAMRGSAAGEQESCCRRVQAPSCCDDEQAPAPGSHHQCGACRTFSPDNHALAPQVPSLPPLALTTACFGIPDIERAPARGFALCTAVDHSPPRSCAPLPLRI